MSTTLLPLKLLIPLQQVKDVAETFDGDLAPEVFEIGPDEAIECPNPLHFDLLVTRVGDGLLAKGSVHTVIRCRCDRCLKYYDSAIADDEVCHYLEPPLPDVVDLTADVREDILINVPQKFLCAETCKGLCPTCGQNLNVRPCSCPAEAPASSSPWDQLDGLKV